MSEIKHQFHVGDMVELVEEAFVDLNPGGDYYVFLWNAIHQGSHRVVASDMDGWVRLDATGCETIWFRPDALRFDDKISTTPIDDLI